MKIYKVLENFYFGGSIDYPDDEHGIPLGYTRTAPPADLTLGENEYLKWIGTNWIKTTEPPPELAKSPKFVSKLDFLNLLGDDEYVAILSASKTDVAVEAWINKFNLIDVVDLNDDKTADWLTMFVSKGLLTQEKADQILQNFV